MTLFGTIRSASTTTQSISKALQVVQRNIAGANDPYYDRQQYNFVSSPYVGGISLDSITRAVAPLLEQVELFQNAVTSNSETLNEIYQEIKSIVGLDDESKPTLVALTEDFIAAWQNYNQNPSSAAARSEVIRRAELIGLQLRDISNRITELRIATELKAREEIETVNQLLVEIRDLNQRVATARASNSDSGTIESRRDELLARLSKLIRIQVTNKGNGQISIYAVGDRDPQINPITTGHNSSLLLNAEYAAQFDLDGQFGLRLTGLPRLLTDAEWINDNQNFRLPSGSIRARLEALRNNVDEQDSAVGIFTRIENQLDAFAALWTRQGTPNNPSFRDAYDNLPTSTPPRVPPEVDTEFFTAPAAGQQTNRFNLTVNPELLADPGRLKRIDLHTIVETFNRNDFDLQNLDAANNIFVDVLGLEGRAVAWQDQTYLELITSLNNHWGRVINQRSDDSQFQGKQQEAITRQVQDITGVDVNEELADMTVLQNSYRANARVLQTVLEMLDSLLAIST